MKNSWVSTATKTSAACCIAVLLFVLIPSCFAQKLDRKSSSVKHSAQFLSEDYRHFEGGVLFTDLEQGFDVLWYASFKHGRIYKENAAFLIPEGLLILPNSKNTTTAAQLSTLPLQTIENRLNVFFNGEYVPVLAIIHTHIVGVAEPSPRTDFQYGYLGIHNYVMGFTDIFDAYKNESGSELYQRVGGRAAYPKLIANMELYAPKDKLAEDTPGF